MIKSALAASSDAASSAGIFADPTFWSGTAFVIFFALIFWKGRHAILKGLDSRAEDIRSKLDEAEKLRDEAQNTLAAYQRKQRDAMEEADQIVAQAKETAARLREQALADTQKTLERRERLAMEKIAQAEAAALAAVRDQAVEIAIGAATKVLGDKLSKDQSSKIIDEAIDDLPGKLN